MPELDDIVQRIALTGQDDVIESFGEIGKAGVEAFEKIAEKAGHTAELVAGFAASMAALGGAFFLWAEHASEAAHHLEILAQQTNESVESISALQGAIASLGGSSEGLGNAFRRMGTTITREWDQIKKEVRDAADVVINDNLKVESAEQALFRARDARAKAFGGPGASPAQLEAEKRLEAQTKLDQAEQALHEAEKKRNEDRLNAPKAYTAAIGEVIRGEKNLSEAGKEANLTTQNILKGLITNTPSAQKAIRELGGDFGKALEDESTQEALKHFEGGLHGVISAGPRVKEVLYNFADFMKNSGDATKNSAIMMQLFGRTMGSDLIAPLMRGSAAIKEQEKEMERHGLVITEEMTKPAIEFHEAYNKLSYVLSTTTKQIGLLFDPVFAKGMEDFTKYIEENHEAIMKWATDLANTVTPYIKGFFDAMQGLLAAISGQQLDPDSAAGKWEKSWERIGSAIQKAASVIQSALNIIKSALSIVFGGEASGFSNIEAFLGGLAVWELGGKRLAGAFLGGFLSSFRTGLTTALAGAGLAAAPAAAAAGATAAGAAAPAAAGAVGGAAAGGAAGLVGGILTTAVVGLIIGAVLEYGIEKLVEYIRNKMKTEAEKPTTTQPTREERAEVPGGGPTSRRLPGEGPGADKIADLRAKIQKEDEDELQDKINRRRLERLVEPRKPIDELTGRPTEQPTGPGALTARRALEIERQNQLGANLPKDQQNAMLDLMLQGKSAAEALKEVTEASHKAAEAKHQEATEAKRPKLGESLGITDLSHGGSMIPSDVQREIDAAKTAARKQITPDIDDPKLYPERQQAKQAETTAADNASTSLGKIPEPANAAATGLQNAATAAQGFADRANAATPRAGGSTAEEKAGGGEVGGWGSGKSDSVPIMASKGEFVVRADGSNLGDAVHYFAGKGMALGGAVLGLLGGYAEGGDVSDDDEYQKLLEKQRSEQHRANPSEGGIARGTIAYGGRSRKKGQRSDQYTQDRLQANAEIAASGGNAEARRQIEEEFRRDHDDKDTGAWAGGLIQRALRGFAQGGLVGGFTSAISGARGYASGGAVASTASTPAALSYHQLDLRTNAGTFSASVSEDTMNEIRRSSLSGKISQTGTRPTWYS